MDRLPNEMREFCDVTVCRDRIVAERARRRQP
jgi:predicted RNA-binding Zn ribbon-like protein